MLRLICPRGLIAPRILAFFGLCVLVGACSAGGGSDAMTGSMADPQGTPLLSALGLTAQVAQPSSTLSPISNSNLCLAAGTSAMPMAGAPVVLASCGNAVNQLFNTSQNLLLVDPNFCLVGVASSDNSSAISVVACDPNAQAPNGAIVFMDGTLQVESPNTSLCVGVNVANVAPGAGLTLSACSPNLLAQAFSYGPNPSSRSTTGTLGSATNGNTATASSANTTTASSANSTPSTNPSGDTSDLSGTKVAGLKVIPWDKFVPQRMRQGLVNSEQEAYLTDGSTISTNSSNQLVITARPKGNNNTWYSGRLNGPLLGTTKGYTEAKIKLPTASGTWPAFWLMPCNNSPTWPQGGEVDILEMVNGSNSAVSSTHFGPSPSQVTSTSKSKALGGTNGAWHTYGVAWDTTHLAFYIDGVKFRSHPYESGSPFAQRFPKYCTILNLAMGGTWPKYANDSIGKQVMIFDYVAQSDSVPDDF